MKYISLLVLLCLSTGIYAQLKDGIYKSGKGSYRDNYLLVVKGKTLTLYGWELKTAADTIYFKGNIVITKDNGKELRNWTFSKIPVTATNFTNFKTSPGVTIEKLQLYNHLLVKNTKKQLVIYLTKDYYDNAADTFIFYKVR